MAITTNFLLQENDTTDATIFTTASIAPASNELILLAVVSGRVGGGDNPDTVTGNGLTWVEMATVTLGRGISLWRSMGASPSSGVLTITFPQEQENAMWAISEFGGDIDTTGSNGAGATNTDSNVVADSASAATVLSITLASFSDAGNATFGCFGVDVVGDYTVGTGFSLIVESAQRANQTTKQMTQWRNDNHVGVDMEISTSARIIGVAAELFAAATIDSLLPTQSWINQLPHIRM